MKTFASFLAGLLLFVSSGGDISTALAQQDPPRLSNISTRGQVLTGDNVMIGGFVIGGNSPKTVVIRARGPSLAQFGVPGSLQDPSMRLFAGQTEIGQNDDYTTAPNLMFLNASGYAPTDSRESAMLVSLAPGAYTAIVSGANNTTGVAIVEVFEVDSPGTPLVNISTRGQVLTGDNVMIGGFIIQGSGPQTVLLRARGPSLGAFGLTGLLANPKLTLFAGQVPIASNDDWDASSVPPGVAIDPLHPKEAAILATLNPGGYSGIVEGVGGTTGLAIFEVFQVTQSAGNGAAPHVISTSPPNGALSAAVIEPVTVTFSEPMLASSMVSAFTLTGPAGPVAGTVTTNGSLVTFTPHDRLVTAWPYTAAVSTAARDASGTAMSFPLSFNFTTNDTEPPPIVAGCPAPEAGSHVRRVNFGASEVVRRPSGAITSVRVPQSPTGRASVTFLQGQSAATPGSTITEITFSRCPGVIETNLHPSCRQSTPFSLNLNASVFNRPLTAEFGWTTQDQHAGLGCLLPTQEPAYANIRWSFPFCPIGDDRCGFTLSFAEGGY